MQNIYFFIIFLSSYYPMDKSDSNIDLSPLAEESWNKEVSYNNLIDIDGNSYKTIQIGEQEWIAENLRVSH